MKYAIRKYPENLFLILIISLLPISIIVGNLIFQLNLIIIIILFLTHLVRYKKHINIFEDKNEIKVFSVIFFYLILNTLISENWTLSIRRNFLYFEFFLIVLSLRYFLSNKHVLKKITFNWFIIICIVSIDIFFEYTFGFNTFGFTNETGYSGRIASFFKDELIVGSFILSFAIPIFSYFYINNKFKLSIFFILLITGAIFLSGERASSLKIFISLILIFFFWDYKNYLKKYIIAILIFLVVLTSLSPVIKESNFVRNDIIHRYISTTLNIISVDNSLSLKQNLVASRYLNQGIFSYEIFKNNIFFGVGNKNYFEACRKYISGYEKNHCYTHAHQTFYELISEHGLIGSLIILSCLIYLIFLNSVNNLSKKNKKKLNIFRIYLILAFIPLIPSGSFFSSYLSSLFWINYTFYTIYKHNLISDHYEKN
tara:strand:+ start:4919 stop:6199 length:1281 start_codon:yes stop_codon:yes gene_type:complete